MATDQQFCLRWNNHQSTLISVFDSLLENGTLVDCTLAAEGQYLKAHKVVLSACSPYLETLLSQHYEKHPIVILKDVKFSELKSMMDYMYRGEVNISQDQLGTFLKAAESLQIKGLSDNGDDARDVGSTTKKPDAPRPSVTQTRAPVESKRPAPIGDLSDTSRDGSISPSLKRRRRTRRPSQGDDPDSNLDNNVCDLPAAQSTPMSVPSAAPVQSLPKQIVKTEPPPPMPDPVKKEILDPPAEPLLEPKTEYLDYMNNENSIEVEDLTLDDDDEEGLDSSMDASRPGPSHGDLSQGGYPPWTMTGDQSGTDEIFMAAQEAVGAATGQQRDSQEKSVKRKAETLMKFMNEVTLTKTSHVKGSLPTGKKADTTTPTQEKSASDKLLQQVSAEIEESIQKVVVTLSDQQEVLVVIDGTDGNVIHDLPSSQMNEEVVEHTTIDKSEIEFDVSSGNSPKKRGRKVMDHDGYRFNQTTRQYNCIQCEKCYKSKQSMIIHVKQCVGLTPGPSGTGKMKKMKTPRKNKKTLPLEDKYAAYFTFDETKCQWTCKDCGKAIKTKQAVLIHKSKCGNNIKKCMYCDYEGRTATNVRVHMMNNHNIIPRLNSDGTWIY